MIAAIEMLGISKSFEGIEVLHAVDFDVRPGEVHALVGENGAGKSTLMKIAAGVHQPSAGTMAIANAHHPSPTTQHLAPFAPRTPIDALNAGIAMVHQELSLAPDVSIAENILAGREPLRAGMVRWRELYARAQGMMSEFGLHAPADAPVSSLGIGYRQVVEILKALASDPRVVIFDEPTSSLEAHESELVLKTIRRLAERGIAVVYISHRMGEVFKVSDRVTVLRDGSLVSTRAISETTLPEVVNAMVGRALTDLYPPKAQTVGDELLRVDGLTCKEKVEGVCFMLRKGEIVGFSGLVGSGRTEVMRAIFDADEMDSGTLTLQGRQVKHRSITDAMADGIGYVPEERKTLGLFLDRSLEDNLASACMFGQKDHRVRPQDVAKEYSLKMAIKARDVEQEVSSLSGGNQQKVLLARWMATRPQVLIVDEPTRGVDIGAKGEIHRLLREYAEQGNGVIVVSSEMPELLGLCDRILVMREGRIVGEVQGPAMTEERLIELAMGRG